MKIIASYKKQPLAPLLTLSLVGHAVVFGVGGFLKPAPEYTVVTAPSSMEVVLLEESQPTQKIEEVIQEKVISAVEAEAVIQQNEEVEENKKEVKEDTEKNEEVQPFVSSLEKGALEDIQPEYLRNPAPIYPGIAKRRGWEGLVLLRVYVNQAGDPVEVHIKSTSGYHILDQAALKAVREWKFKPASLGNQTFGAWLDVPVRFILEE